LEGGEIEGRGRISLITENDIIVMRFFMCVYFGSIKTINLRRAGKPVRKKRLIGRREGK
jgi:hypothetical protein